MLLHDRLGRHVKRLANHTSLKDLFKYAVLIRGVMWIAMAIVAAMIPSHNPGDDVVRFEIRSESECFAESNTFCACSFACSTYPMEIPLCHEYGQAQQNFVQTHVYPFLLRPLTRWDAARFLRLAYRPQLRQPNLNMPDESERAHAFFPMFPLGIQYIAIMLLRMPRWCLPATCEGVLVLAAFILNSVCYLLALCSLYCTTYLALEKRQVSVPLCRLWSSRVGFLFLFNPALVFFTTNYSESLFAALVFVGSYFAEAWDPLVAVIPWSLATATRSNGIFYFGFISLYAVGKAVRPEKTWLLRLWHFFSYMCAALVILYPLYRYNENAVASHCITNNEAKPVWCDEAQNNRMFLLYSYIQRKHWDVGFLRYYQLKQIPNFLLAAPILCISLAGIIEWVKYSWRGIASCDDKPIPGQIVDWAVSSLQTFAGMSLGPQTPVQVLVGPAVLGHYAVWAVAALLGLTTAHVQISTRLLCSSCPALYWYAAHLVAYSQKWGSLYIGYSFLYIILGAILHPLWLPWT